MIITETSINLAATQTTLTQHRSKSVRAGDAGNIFPDPIEQHFAFVCWQCLENVVEHLSATRTYLRLWSRTADGFDQEPLVDVQDDYIFIFICITHLNP
uniref:Uncharacterized protein n=1 Tax=Alloyangia mangrovi TaxID=1779329 RepID=A0A2A3K2T5_9RHOB